MKNLYYCYSYKLHLFLTSLGFRYVDKSINTNTNTRYFTYEKSEILDRAIMEWNNVKHINS